MDGWKQKLQNALAYIKTNKYNLFFVGAIAILIIIIIAMITVTISFNKNKPSKGNSPTQTVSQSPGAISGSPDQQVPITTANPTQAAIIENQTQPQITPNVAVPYTVSEIKKFGNEWAVMNITNADVGNGLVIVKLINGAWKVVLGPGSYFPQDQLQSIGAPQTLIDNLYPQTSPSVVSPSPTVTYQGE